MSKKKSAAKLAVAMEAARQAKEQARPAVDDARARLAPMVDDARHRLTPVVQDARHRLTPVVQDARERLADLTEVVATRLDERLPDDATPAVVKRASAHSTTRRGSGVAKVLLVGGVGAAVFALVRRLMGRGSQPRWQSTNPAGTSGAGAFATSASPSATVAGTASAAAASADAGERPSDDKAAGSPDEAVADAAETTHVPTTPDAPAQRIDIKE